MVIRIWWRGRTYVVRRRKRRQAQVPDNVVRIDDYRRRRLGRRTWPKGAA